MHFVYVLRSVKDGKLYMGCTSDLSARLLAHNKGQVQSTKNRRPLTLYYSEQYNDKYEAFFVERFYKTATGRKELLKKTKEYCRIV